MRGMRAAAILLALVLSAAACANDAPPVEVADPAAEDQRDDRSTSPEDGDERTDEDRKGKSKGGGKSRSGGSEDGDDGQSGGGGRRDPATEEGGGEDDGSSAYVPRDGTYTYEQSGYEEFCDTATCDRQDLPPRQEVGVAYRGGSHRNILVVTTARMSNKRLTRTTTLHAPRETLIRKVRVKFDYQGFSFDNTYAPDPPVESIRYPLKAGSRWSGSWKADTSGDYSIEVGRAQQVTVGGRTVRAFPLRSTTNFRGEFEGRAVVTTWIDPATAAVVRTEGELRMKSAFGRYNTEFAARLRAAPGY